jgi:pimeloyl-[acyl-carrier protein] methyl ester esterase
MSQAPSTSRSRQISLVLLPGLDGTGRLFHWLLAALPPEIDPLVISFPGDIEADYAALEARVVALLPKDRPFALLGESFSGPLALRLAARGDANPVAIILVASFIKRPVVWAPRFVRHLLQPFMARAPIPLPLLQWLVLGEAPSAALVEMTVDSLRSVDPAVLTTRAKAALGVDATAALIHCPVPILYLGGSRDRLISPEIAGQLQALRPDLDCVMLEAPHFVLQRAPALAAAAIIAFLAKHSLLETASDRPR